MFPSVSVSVASPGPHSGIDPETGGRVPTRRRAALREEPPAFRCVRGYSARPIRFRPVGVPGDSGGMKSDLIENTNSADTPTTTTRMVRTTTT
ncbi:hypothetical protein RHA1_ro07257 [Rhodococcus jostii RHA1]|uniref:Uncharacterized protein n=1 Tax=Rhodococcus jostii (strain RHA1) TaxID=101510 RepID=Q0S0B5_RHOJR|nr:hypothetical protein RHA1_ro07257 [Rhodococcus jostii RHA1]